MEEWKEIRDFPKYSVSNHGRICREPSGRLLSIYPNQYGVACVGLMRGRVQCNRSVSLLVARAFIPRISNFDTPINLDGNRFNNRVDNLMWRPRRFAVEYNRQFQRPYPYSLDQPIRDKKTGKEYPNSFVCATTLGLLERDLVLSILNNTYTWPTYQFFEAV
jgi:hypothetical protein